MKPRVHLVILVLGGLIASVQHLAAGGGSSIPVSTYLIKSKLVENVPEAVTQLRRFVPAKQDEEQRCQRLDVLLSTLRSKNLSYFDVAEIAMTRADQIKSRVNQIDFEGLRNLYIEAISGFLKQGIVDDGLLELIDCLSNRFRTRDAKARSFLNDEQLKTIVKQYKLIAAQPLSSITHPEEHKLPEDLRWADVHPLIKLYLLRVFDNDEQKVARLFVGGDAASTVEAPQKAGVTADASTAAPAAAATSNAAGQTEPVGVQEIDADSREFLQLVSQVLSQVYNKLPYEAKIGDRCQSYSFVINAKSDDLSHAEFVEALIESVQQHVKTEADHERVQLPSDEDRENFLFAAEFLPEFMQNVDPEALLDLQECARILSETAPSVQS